MQDDSIVEKQTSKFYPIWTCKVYHRRQVQEWVSFSSKVSEQIQNDIKSEDFKVDMEMSMLNSLPAKWVSSFCDEMHSCSDYNIGRKRSGLTNFLNRDSHWEKEKPFMEQILPCFLLRGLFKVRKFEKCKYIYLDARNYVW